MVLLPDKGGRCQMLGRRTGGDTVSLYIQAFWRAQNIYAYFIEFEGHLVLVGLLSVRSRCDTYM